MVMMVLTVISMAMAILVIVMKIMMVMLMVISTGDDMIDVVMVLLIVISVGDDCNSNDNRQMVEEIRLVEVGPQQRQPLRAEAGRQVRDGVEGEGEGDITP